MPDRAARSVLALAAVALLAASLSALACGVSMASGPPVGPPATPLPAPAIPDGGAVRLPLEDLALRGDARCADGRLYEASWFVSDLSYEFTRAVIYRDGRIIVLGDGIVEDRVDQATLLEVIARASAARLEANAGRREDDPFRSPSHGGAVAACLAGHHRAVEWHVGGPPGPPPVPAEVSELHASIRAAADAARGRARARKKGADGGSP